MLFMLLWWRRVTQIQRRQLTSTHKVWSLSWEDPTSWNHLETCSFLCLALELDSLEDWNYHVVHLHVSSLWSLSSHSLTAVSPKGTLKTNRCKSKHSRRWKLHSLWWPSLRRHMLSLPSVSTQVCQDFHKQESKYHLSKEKFQRICRS